MEQKGQSGTEQGLQQLTNYNFQYLDFVQSFHCSLLFTATTGSVAADNATLLAMFAGLG
jgi:hypothetical protein